MPYKNPFRTRCHYIYYNGEYIRVRRVDMNLYLPSHWVMKDDIVNVGVDGLHMSCFIDLFDFVVYGMKGETTLWGLARSIGLAEGIQLLWIEAIYFKLIREYQN
jgi:hypothetical protein